MAEELKRAERVLRTKLARMYRVYGEAVIRKVAAVEFLGVVDGFYQFQVEFERELLPQFYEVRLYAKSARVYSA